MNKDCEINLKNSNCGYHIKNCKTCNTEFTQKSNHQKYHSPDCKKIRDNKVRNEKYKTDPKYRDKVDRWSKNKIAKKPEKYKLLCRERQKKHLNKKRENHEFVESENKRLRDYRVTETGKITTARHHSRRREYGHSILFDNVVDGKVTQHHVTDNDVVFIPPDLHGVYPTNPKETHRINLSYIVKQLYPEFEVKCNT